MIVKLLSRVAAMVFLCIPAALILRLAERLTLRRLNSDPMAYLARQRVILGHGIVYHFFSLALIGVIAVVCVEGLSYLFRGEWWESSRRSNTDSESREAFR